MRKNTTERERGLLVRKEKETDSRDVTSFTKRSFTDDTGKIS